MFYLAYFIAMLVSSGGMVFFSSLLFGLVSVWVESTHKVISAAQATIIIKPKVASYVFSLVHRKK